MQTSQTIGHSFVTIKLLFLPKFKTTPILSRHFIFSFKSQIKTKMSTINFSVVGASTLSGVIGINADLPWGRMLPSDLNRFKELTQNGILIMGYQTALSMRSPVLPNNRHSIVVTSKWNNPITTSFIAMRNKQDSKYLHFASSLNHALEIAESDILTINESKEEVNENQDCRVFVVGGKRLFEEAMQSTRCRNIYWTWVYREFNDENNFQITKLDDSNGPIIDEKKFEKIRVHDCMIENLIPFQFFAYKRRNTVDDCSSFA